MGTSLQEHAHKELPPIVEFSEHDDARICELQRIVYPESPVYGDPSLGHDFWQWWFWRMPWKKSRIFGVAIDGTVVGVRPLSFLPVVVDGKEELCGVLNATVTHPGYRKLGIFSRTLVHTLQIAEKEEQVRFAISFPNDNSYPLHLKNPIMAALCDLPLYIKIFNPRILRNNVSLPEPFCRVLLFLVQRSQKYRSPHGIKIKEITSFDERFDSLWEHVKQDNRIWIARTRQYLTWRYAESPLGGYSVLAASTKDDRDVVGYIILKTEERFGMRLGLILDLVVASGRTDLAASLVAVGLQRFRELGAEAAGCLMLPHHPFVRALRANGMMRVPKRLAPRAFHVTVARLGGDEMFRSFISDARHWYLTWGDTDNV